MTKSELIEIITAKQKHLPAKDVELALKQILEIMSDALSQGERIEIRGFGSFSLHFRPPRQGRNPKTGEAVALSGKHVPHFKPGKDLRELVNYGAGRPIRLPPSPGQPQRMRCVRRPNSAGCAMPMIARPHAPQTISARSARNSLLSRAPCRPTSSDAPSRSFATGCLSSRHQTAGSCWARRRTRTP